MSNILICFVVFFMATGSTLTLQPLLGLSLAQTTTCSGGNLPPGNGGDLEVTGACTATEGQTYHYGNVNIYKGGTLTFVDPAPDKKIHFWARSILVEKDSSLIAGGQDAPIGTKCQAAREQGSSVYCGGMLTFHLYGEDQGAFPFGDDANKGNGGKGITCKTDERCGVDKTMWDSNGAQKFSQLPGGGDYFYAYEPLPYDDGDPKGYFGYKVLAVSYGGTLQLFGRKGASYGTEPAASDSGKSWVRLSTTLNAGDKKLFLDRKVDPDWEPGDRIVVTTTDYLPGHSEQLEICSVDPSNNSVTFTVQTEDEEYSCGGNEKGAEHLHNGIAYPLNAAKHPGIDRLNLDIKVEGKPAAETRAAVALLSRSIRIVSEGASFNADNHTTLPTSGSGAYFGGHTLVRQGFKRYQMQGVEFYQLGQGGRMERYPVHLDRARKTPQDTFVKDCSVHDSMTRWITVHATQGVTLARNVGYKSIGHGYYLEDGPETDNKFYSNIGIFARAAIDNAQNPRKVPGILAGGSSMNSEFPYNSDFAQPTVFWIMNGWNEFQYNMAAGAGACGACFWLVPGANSGWSKEKKWESYASMQKGEARAAMTPLKLFRGNYCSTAMNSFNTIGASDPCLGLDSLGPIHNPLVPAPKRSEMEMYYPITKGFGGGGGRFPTRCDELDCTTVTKCEAANRVNCMVTVLDRYTTAFHWTETNFAAVWLRPQWYLVINSVISDVQSGGLGFVTGGDYTASNAVPGQWMLARKNVFIGHTQPDNPYASNAGPFGPGGLAPPTVPPAPIDRCYAKDEGISMPLSNFANFQRLFNIYDGPAYQETNAFLDIAKTAITDCPAPNPNQQCNNSHWMYGRVLGMRRSGSTCYLPNAAIGWKQPNGFYYPPAFHSTNLFFDNVDIRHFVIEPQFKPGTFKTLDDNNYQVLKDLYCTWNPAMFDNFSGIDRQTELNDDDGSLTGLVNTISVNEDSFFDSPVETIECRSDETTKTSPYDYVTTVVYPDCATLGSTVSCMEDPEQPWDSACSNEKCYGVPLFRQYLNKGEKAGPGQEIRMAGMNFYQRSNLTVNHGLYYIDTSVSAIDQAKGVTCLQNPHITVHIDLTPQNLGKLVRDFPNNSVDPKDGFLNDRAFSCTQNVFRAGHTYNVFFLYAKPQTRQTYQIYVGPGLDVKNDVKMVRADIFGTNQLKIPSHDFPDTAGQAHPWSRSYDSNSGILTVSVDLTDFEGEFTSTRAGLCQPQSFCTWDGADCVCNKAMNDPKSVLYNPALYKDCIEKTGTKGRTICSWAGNDIDCPEHGCFGFSFKLPAGFTTVAGERIRPTPTCFEADNDWKVPWTPATPDLAQACFNPPVDPLKFCNLSGDPAMTRNILWGTPRNDVLVGTAGDDIILGRAGDDRIYGLEGDDWLSGGKGNDMIFGGPGDDTILGGPGDDSLFGERGHDSISGDSGDDYISGGAGNDKLAGGPGHDMIFGGSGNDVLSGGAGHDAMFGGSGQDQMNGGSGEDYCGSGESVRGCESMDR